MKPYGFCLTPSNMQNLSRTMKNLIILLSFGLLISSCISEKHYVSIDNIEYRVSRPPNMVKIDNNFFADQTEIRNIDWYEYVTWMGETYGLESDQYEASLPDTTVWSGELSYSEPRISAYFKHPAFANYPVVGVSYAQVQAYCRWRTDRVAEIILVQEGILEARPRYGSEAPFTISDIAELDIRKPIYIPTFRLPTEEEWEQLASGGLDIQRFPNGIDEETLKGNAKAKAKYNVVDTADEAQNTAPVDSYWPNNYKVYNTIGNVAEMVAEPGVSKGGSYNHSIEECMIENNITYAKAENWLGFRCVAYYEPVQFKQG